MRTIRRRGRRDIRPGQRPNTFWSELLHQEVTINNLRPYSTTAPTAFVEVAANGRLHLVGALIEACTPFSITSVDLAYDLGLEETFVGGERDCLLPLRRKHGRTNQVSIHVVVIPNYLGISPIANIDPTTAVNYTHSRLELSNAKMVVQDFEDSSIRYSNHFWKLLLL